MRTVAVLLLLSALAFADTSPRATVPSGVTTSWIFSRGVSDERSGKRLELSSAKIERGTLNLQNGYAVSRDEKVGVVSASCAIELRVKFEAINPNWALLAMRGTNGQQIGETFGLYCGAQGQLYFNANRAVVQSTNGVLPTGEWLHLLATVDKDAGTMKLFVNGREVATANGPPGGVTDRGGPTYIGGCEQFQYPMTGSISRVRFWGKALAPKDAERLSKER
jgi:hypothetical protein